MAWEYDGGLGLRGLVGLWFRPGTGDWAFLRGDAPVSFLPTGGVLGCLGDVRCLLGGVFRLLGGGVFRLLGAPGFA